MVGDNKNPSLSEKIFYKVFSESECTLKKFNRARRFSGKEKS